MTISNPPPPAPGDFQNIDFEIEKEGWNTYELKDGAMIKGRIIVTRISKVKNGPPGQFAFASQNIFVTFAPSDLRGQPSTPLPINQIKKSDMIPVETVRTDEVWNVYKLLNTGDRIRVKLVAADILRVKDSYDQLGEPYFIVTSGLVITPIGKTVGS